ncbi:copper chaperone PCu(A)C [Rhodococcus sp. X156]|uniref:copper chaperone PCu(A)C n=1 Tax=Rhodococcus sp. X156 TaxID=2499145 RepID=UPI000FDC9A4E|nr:copper chaperone PCu(A)C [Rhodococcus sp. X156]
MRSSVKAAIGAALAVGSVTLLAGCGAGQVNTIGSQVAAVNGATARVGELTVLDATIAAPVGEQYYYRSGESAPLLFTVANPSVQGDKLVSVSSAAAQEVTLSGATDIGAGTNLVATAPNSSQPSAAAVAPGRSTDKEGQLTATLEGLKQDVGPGPTVDVTFTFERAGQITLPVPMGAPATTERPTPKASTGEHSDSKGGH